MRFFVPGLLFFLAYALFARWYFVCEIRNNCVPIEMVEESRSETLSLWNGNESVLLGYEHFRFEPNSEKLLLTTDNQYFIDEVAGYMRRYSNNDLLITGHFTSAEIQGAYGLYENLGLARAHTARRLLMRNDVVETRVFLDFVRVDADTLDKPLSFQIITDID